MLVRGPRLEIMLSLLIESKARPHTCQSAQHFEVLSLQFVRFFDEDIFLTLDVMWASFCSGARTFFRFVPN